jgi:hypothetical protein
MADNHAWQPYPSIRPVGDARDQNFIVAIRNPYKAAMKGIESTSPDYWLFRALYLGKSFMSLESGIHFKDQEVAYFYEIPALPEK